MPRTESLDWLDPHGDADPVIDPAGRIRAMAARAGVTDDPPLPSFAVATFMEPTFERLVEATDASPSGWHGPTRIGRLDGEPLAVSRMHFGAPAAVALSEELIGGGVRTLLVGGATGSLQPSVTIDDYVVPTSAVREEGTSLHYVTPEHRPTATGPATRALIELARASGRTAHDGRVWTTDAPYREFAGKVQAYAAGGVLGVDMEASALMTLAEFRGVNIGLLLTVSDHVFDPDWPNIFQTDRYRENCVQLAEVLLAAARQLLSRGA